MAGESALERPVRRGKVDDTGGDRRRRPEALLPPHPVGPRRRRATATCSSCRLAAYLEGYYYKPRLDWELLERHHEGLIATPAASAGLVLQALLAGGPGPGPRRWPAGSRDIFGRDSLFVEIQDHGIAAQHKTNPS